VLAWRAGEGAPRRTLALRLRGGSRHAEPVGLRPLTGHSSYLIGSDPDNWVSRVPHFEAVEYQDIYPGVDLIFYGVDGGLEYDFVVGAHADPSAIQLELHGAEQVSIDSRGALAIRVGELEVVQSAPRAYQYEVAVAPDGETAAPIAVAARFIVHETGEQGSSVGFEVGDYDPGLPLVIDPAVGFSTFLGGSGTEEMPRVAVDRQANVYVAGTTSSIDLPPGDGLRREATGPPAGADVGGADSGGADSGGADSGGADSGGADSGGADSGGADEATAPDAFVIKLSPDGSTILYVAYVGGGGTDRSNGIVVDGEGNAFLTGQTDSVDFPTRASLGPELSGPTDAFVTKLNASGTGFVYSTYLGGSGTEAGMALGIDAGNNVYVTGQTSSPDFPTLASMQDSLGGPSDGFVSKIGNAGDALVYSTYLGGTTSNDGGLGIAVDDAGAAFITGITESEDFPLQEAMQTVFGGGGNDAFVSAVDASGASLVYSTYLGGSGADVGLSIATDGNGQAYLTGQTTSSDFPTYRALQRVMIAGPDAFIVKLAATGEGLIFSTYLGGSGVEVGAGVAVDQSSNVHLAGMTSSTDFPLVDALQPQIGGGADAFILRLDNLGSALSYSTYLGGAGNDAGVGVALDGAGNALVVGQTASADFPLLYPAQAAHAGIQDAFVARFCLALVFERNETFPSAGGNGDITVTAPDGCVWPAVSEVEWITVTSGNTGVGSDMVLLEVAPNGTGAPRAGMIRVAGKTVILEQAEARECDYRLSDNSESFYSQGGVGRVRVFTSEDCPWTAVSTVPWISISGGDTGIGEGTVSFTVQANRTGRQRAGTLIIAGQVFTVFDWLRDERY
jgi:hypothetical protein